MDYSYLQQKFPNQKTRVGVIGATRGFGYTIIAQLVDTPMCDLRFICSRHPEECEAALKELGYDEKLFKVCPDRKAIEATSQEDILIISDYNLMVYCGVDSIVECTGNTAVGSKAAVLALESKINVCMVSKETDSICGTYFHQLAARNGVVYALANGDQPRDLADLYSWAQMLGLEIICAGKSSENDLVFNPETGDVTYLEDHPSAVVPELSKCWNFQGKETLEKRAAALSGFLKPISADLCEMNLVSNITGLVPAAPFLNYPVARIPELADIFIPEEDGGILKKTGVVDVFYNLRRPDEASFAGGEFVIVRCKSEKVWELIRGKGHVVSKNGRYACIYYPYHFLGVETPTSLILAHFLGIGSHPECRQVSFLAGVADKTIAKGTVLSVAGHHHEIADVTPQLLEHSQVPDETLPFYVLNGAKVTADINPGEAISSKKVCLDESAVFAYELFRKGLEIK